MNFAPLVMSLTSKRCCCSFRTHARARTFPQDYRLVKGMDVGERVMLHPLDDGAVAAAYEKLWVRMTDGAAISPATLTALGHEIAVPEAAHTRNTARFGFDDLCSKALGAADYLAIAKAYHTVFIHGTPVLRLDVHGRDTVRRFITLVDTLYDANVKLVLFAGAAPIELFQVPPPREDGSTFDEVFAFDRTVRPSSCHSCALPTTHTSSRAVRTVTHLSTVVPSMLGTVMMADTEGLTVDGDEFRRIPRETRQSAAAGPASIMLSTSMLSFVLHLRAHSLSHLWACDVRCCRF